MRKLINFIPLVLALLLFCACNHATFITPSKTQFDFTIEGGEENVSVSSDGSCEVTECPKWVTAEVQDSTLVINVSRNDTGSQREGNIVLTSGDVTATIGVKQASKCTHITPESDAIEIEKDGGSKTVNIDTDGALQVTAPEGFTAEYAGGVLTVSADANEGGTRGGEITLTADEQTATINVTQAGNICPTCNGTGKEKCSKCGGKGFLSEHRHHDGIDYGCASCGGGGNRMWNDGWVDMSFVPTKENHGFRKGSGKMNCPTCGGKGH